MHDFRRFGALLLGVIAFLLPARAQYTGPDAGQKVSFLGDSITQNGWDFPGGYLHLIDLALAQEGHKIQVIPAGISGQTSKDMLARIGDVLSKKPDWMLLSCGVNDVWHGADGVPLDQYKINITSIVDQARAAGAKVVILASTPIGLGNLKDDNNTKLLGYNDFLRSLADQDHLLFVDLNTAMVQGSAARLKEAPHQVGDAITMDGVHPNILGYEIMASSILRAWGVTDAQIAEVTPAWEQIPHGMAFSGMQFDGNDGITLHDFLILRSYAESKDKPVRDVISDIIKDGVKKIIDGAPADGAKP
jgi:lysophospholipase L1-like esterase